MPLITSNTDLKSLSFGHDRPGWANSGQPFLYFGFPNLNIGTIPLRTGNNPYVNLSVDNFVYKPINPIPYSQNSFYSPSFQRGVNLEIGLINSANNYIVEGVENVIEGAANLTNVVGNAVVRGAINALNGVIGGINATSDYITETFDPTLRSSYPDFLWRKNRFNLGHSFIDTQRITRFFFTPAGLFFLLKQNLLERQNVKVDGTTRLYSPLNTIAQVGVNAYGYHLNKSGLNPFERSYYKGGNEGYFNNTRDNFGRNRLELLTKNKINKRIIGPDKYGITNVLNRNVLLRYLSGPGSTLGIGFTEIRLQNETRTFTFKDRNSIPGVSFNNKDKNQYNYLTPIGKPNVYWYYNPLDSFGTLGNRSVFQQYRLRNADEDLGTLRTTWFGSNNPTPVLNRDTNIISSSLYAPSGSSATIKRLGTEPTKPEYYTPTGSSVNWSYTAGTGVSSKYVSALNINSISTSSFPTSTTIIGEGSTINSNTNIFGNKNDQDKDLFTLNGKQIINKSSLGKAKNTTFGTSSIQDFRYINFSGSVVSTNYTEFNREKTYQTSQTSYKGNWSIAANKRVLDPNIPISPDQENPERSSDIVDFNFTLQYPGGDKRLIDFTAYIEDWSDGVRADWNAIKYMGRAESFYKYGGFSREGSVTFLVPALSRRNLIANYKKLNALAWSVAPSYSDIGLMRGIITNFTMGDYFRKMPILIKSVDFVEIADMGWDINRKVDGDVWPRTDNNFTGQLPKGIKVTLQYTVIHNYTPQAGAEFIGYDPDNSNKNVFIPELTNPTGSDAITSGDFTPLLKQGQ
jgi:hypothetical protein